MTTNRTSHQKKIINDFEGGEGSKSPQIESAPVRYLASCLFFAVYVFLLVFVHHHLCFHFFCGWLYFFYIIV